MPFRLGFVCGCDDSSYLVVGVGIGGWCSRLVLLQTVGVDCGCLGMRCRSGIVWLWKWMLGRLRGVVGFCDTLLVELGESNLYSNVFGLCCGDDGMGRAGFQIERIDDDLIFLGILSQILLWVGVDGSHLQGAAEKLTFILKSALWSAHRPFKLTSLERA